MPQITVPRPTLEDFQRQTQALLPAGRFWNPNSDSVIGRIIGVLAGERLSRHTQALAVLDTESVPTTSVQLLADWEQASGLPDPCIAAPSTLAQRWQALADVWFADHPPTPANMVAWALQAGWNISIREQTDFVADVSMAEEVVGESDFVWVVTVIGQEIIYFTADKNVGDDPLWVGPDLSTLECVLSRAAPAHTQVYFVVP